MSGLIDRCDEKAPEYRDISRFFGIRIGQKWREDETKNSSYFVTSPKGPSGRTRYNWEAQVCDRGEARRECIAGRCDRGSHDASVQR